MKQRKNEANVNAKQTRHTVKLVPQSEFITNREDDFC